jgi:LytS/YehU family sensor histidine kinase
MILQPLVENSVKHAVSASVEQVTITLAAREEYDRLVVTVSDNGRAPTTECSRSRAGHGIGLANVRQRLEARFGKEASMVSGPAPEGYTTHLRMPIVRRGEAGQ